MRISYTVSHALIQSGLAEMFLLVWRFFEVMDIAEAIGTSFALLLFVTLYGTFFGLVFSRKGFLFRLFVIPLLSSLFTTLTFVIYPQLGFAGFAWYILFGFLFLAGVLAHAALYGAGARLNPRSDEHEY